MSKNVIVKTNKNFMDLSSSILSTNYFIKNTICNFVTREFCKAQHQELVSILLHLSNTDWLTRLLLVLSSSSTTSSSTTLANNNNNNKNNYLLFYLLLYNLKNKNIISESDRSIRGLPELLLLLLFGIISQSKKNYYFYIKSIKSKFKIIKK